MVKPKYYVYVITDGHEVVYVGKGSGRRLQDQKRRFKCEGSIVEKFTSEKLAYAAEVKWIDQLKPTSNKAKGGNGGWSTPKPGPRLPREYAEIERIGTQRYVAQMLSRKLWEGNIAQFGVSKIALDRIRAVANGTS